MPVAQVLAPCAAVVAPTAMAVEKLIGIGRITFDPPPLAEPMMGMFRFPLSSQESPMSC